MDLVSFIKGDKAKIDSTPIVSGQLLVETDAGDNSKIYIDNEDGTRIQIGGKTSVEDILTSTNTANALSANQGRVLQSNIGVVQTTANTAQTTANTANTKADTAQATANAAMPKNGGTFADVVRANGVGSFAPHLMNSNLYNSNLTVNGSGGYFKFVLQ